jgi:hypothetical protein
MSKDAEDRSPQRKRSRYAFPVRDEGDNEESWADRIERREVELAADRARRARLTQSERMIEDGKDLHDSLDRTPSLTLVLQPSPPYHLRRAQCCAKECTSSGNQPKNDHAIKDEYRVAVLGPQREYYHIECLEKMLDLSPLAATRFFLDTEPYRWNNHRPWTWGMMVEKWFTQRGYINLDAIDHFIDAYDRFGEENREFSTRYISWQLRHGSSNNKHSRPCDCKCPFLGEAPQEPRLEDFELHATEPLPLSDVLQHPYAERLSRPLVVPSILGNVLMYTA